MSIPRSRASMAGGRGRHRGFTLLEMVVVMVLIAALASLSAVLLVQPFRASEAADRRAALVDAAALALDRIVREARNALPNSVRLHSASHVELIRTRSGGRYRRLPPQGGGGGPIFVPARASGAFEVLGGLLEAGAVQTRSPGTGCADGGGDCVSVFNTGQPGFDAYARENIAAITGVAADRIDYDTGGSGPGFRTHSPNQRFYVVDDVVSYRCTDGQLLRFADYGLVSGTPSLAPADGQLVADGVVGCEFRFEAGTSTRRGLLTVRLDLEREGEGVFLLDQAQVTNAP